MNNVLELKGKFNQREYISSGFGGPAMNSKDTVTVDKLDKLHSQIAQIKKFWDSEKHIFTGVLINVNYNKIAAKSNRISGLFKNTNPNLAVVGAKFNADKTKHIITYFLEMRDLDKCLEYLSNTRILLASRHFSGKIDKKTFDDDNLINKIPYNNFPITKSRFKKAIADVSFIDDFKVEKATQKLKQSIITLYNTKTDTKTLLGKLGIQVLDSHLLDNQTIFLDESQIKLLIEKAPYLVSMATEDISGLSPEDFTTNHQTEAAYISSPTIEPTIGVIDTLFDTNVYFSKWVEYHDMVDSNIPKEPNDYKHGTAVSSIIVDGATFNPWLNDGCGRFKVRHFGVALGSKFSSFTIIKQIRTIVAANQDIKVWNISLGSNQEVNDNFISAEAAVLDQIQFENDVIFVVAGTNKPSGDDIIKIGSPADSINGMVVNAVTKDKKSPNYSRKGLALSFFAKPDVSYYGGSKEQYMRVCEPLGAADVAGTSYAAPWIARKLSYLIDILGLKREVAKAMIIDSARGWNEAPRPDEIALFGHGIVPININDIIQTKENEIRFLISEISEKWNTYNYDFPIPLAADKYPYIARATMCYFPKCSRAQGVDYTNTELKLRFGRIKDDKSWNEIKGSKASPSDDSETGYLFEGEARRMFRKWDNVKCISELPKSGMQAKKSYTRKDWGMEVKTNDRLDSSDGIGVRFGIVVTLREIKGVNRIDEFVQNCQLRGWIVREIDVQNKIDINQKINEEIEFE